MGRGINNFRYTDDVVKFGLIFYKAFFTNLFIKVEGIIKNDKGYSSGSALCTK